MESQTVLITGGSRGIGAATVRLAARRGYQVCFSYRSQKQQADALVAEVQSMGRQAISVQSDVSIEADVARMWQLAVERFGTIHALVNNAGILDTQCRLEAMPISRVRNIFNTNVIGSIMHAQQAIKHMSMQKGGVGGSIVNLSSGAARLGSPNEYVDYAASKGAIDTLTVGLAKELAADGIRVNGVRPGTTRTEIHADGGEPSRADRVAPKIPLQRPGEPEEIANAIMWLVSDESSYATGAIIDVTGGL